MATQIRGATQLKEWGDVILSSGESGTHTKMKSGYSPSDNLDIVTKKYVDDRVQGLNVKGACRVATNGSDIDLTGGTFSGVIDGVTLNDGDRVLIKDQLDAVENGIYVYNSSSATFTRASDFDEDGEVTPNSFCFVSEGDNNADTGWVLTTDSPIVVDSTELAFEQFSSAGIIVAGEGLSKDGNILNVNVDDVTVEINGSNEIGVKNGGIDYLRLKINNTQYDGAILSYDLSSDSLKWVDKVDDEHIQDVVGALFVSSSVIDFIYDDNSNTMTADIKDGSISIGKLETLSENELVIGTGSGNVKGEIIKLFDGNGVYGEINNSNTVFTLEDGNYYYHPKNDVVLDVYVNGLLMRNGLDYTLSIGSGSNATQIVFASAPQTIGNNDIITVNMIGNKVEKN